MFVLVKYGDNETLLCNPSCAVVNLLKSIKRRAGYGNDNVTLDLSDETGLIIELDAHKFDYASKHLASHATYILVQKQPVVSDVDSVDGHSTPGLAQYGYVPLLDKYSDHFPNYKVHVAEVEKKKTKRSMSKSPSPAGKFTSKTKKVLHVGKTSARRK